MNPLCLAIDTPDGAVVDELARSTQAHVGIFKVGVTTFTALGPRVVTQLAASRPVFCDLKLNDIPSQIQGAVEVLGALGASFATVHAMGGAAMVRAAAREASPGLKILAVTVLTSLESDDLAAFGIAGTAAETVVRLAGLALEAGAAGLVCSGREAGLLRERFGAAAAGGPLLVVPGIRADGGASADQRRTSGPRAAVDAGADLVVVGRAITKALDPGEAARAIHDQLTA